MRRIIIAITGASGVIYGVRALQLLRDVPDVETHAIISPSALRTAVDELDIGPDEIRSLIASALPSGAQVEISRNYLFRMGVIVWKGRSA